MKMACWNMKTILDKTGSNCPARCSALITYELSRLDIDIAALSEEGSLQEQDAGSEKPAKKKRLLGVGFMLKTSIASKLENLPSGHSNHIMLMRLPLENK